MKRILFSLLLVILTAFSKAQTADEIITNYIAVSGGPENISAIKTVKMAGSGNQCGPGSRHPGTSFLQGIKA